MTSDPTPSPSGWQRLRSGLRRWHRELLILLALLLVLAAPFLLRPKDSTAPTRYDRRLVILTPHSERIRAEFGQAFVRDWKARTGQTVFMDWRVPGGSSEIAVLLKSDFTAAFQLHWQRLIQQPWTANVAQSFLNSKSPATDPARQAFLKSNVGIGVDLFFGGGAYDLQQQADMGTLVASAADKPQTGITALRQKHPAWFTDAGIPQTLSGEPFRDGQDRWIATCLSSFCIVFNRDVLRRLGIEKDPTQWRDLTDPRLCGQIALADPGRSASVTKAFEMLIQQEMQAAITRLQQAPGKLKTPEEITAEGVRLGWTEGLRLIQQISANARYYSDASTKIAHDVMRGDAAAGMCIDFYGRSMQEEVKKPDGTSRIGFVTPIGGTSISVDPIGLLRGAPDPELATAFIEFVLSDAGQKLWSFRSQSPGGPSHMALRRLAVRRDFYTPENIALMSDGEERPYDKANNFVYHPEWTGAAFSTLRFLLRVLCVETHEEQRAAWQTLIKADFPSRATQVFSDTYRIRYETALSDINKVVRSRNKVAETQLANSLSSAFRRNYQLATQFAQRGQ